MSEAFEITVDGWLFRIRTPLDPASRSVLLAIHGWTGNQYSMDIFTQKLKKKYWVIFPCAPFPADGGGFSWIQKSEADQRSFHNLSIAAQNLSVKLDVILRDHISIDPDQINLMGFSQGSALALLYSLKYSAIGTKIALLSGFLPDGLQPVPGSLKNRSYYIAHGRQDTIIPVEQAHKLASFIEDCGGWFDFCEANTGHKLSLDCFNRMQDFFL